MGFAEANSHQLVPTVGTKKFGATISAVPAITEPATSAALGINTNRAESDLFESPGFIVHLPILRSAFTDLRPGVYLTFGEHRIHINRWGTLRLTDRIRSTIARIPTNLRPSHAPTL